MNQVKYFSTTSGTDLEMAINRWLQEQHKTVEGETGRVFRVVKIKTALETGSYKAFIHYTLGDVK